MTVMLRPRDPPARRIALDHLSYTAINTFLKCPARFHYRYILGLPEQIIFSSLAFGKAFHASLQLHFQHHCQGRATRLDQLFDAFWDAWNAEPERTIIYRGGEDINVICRLAERLLRAFLASPFAEPGGTVIGVEKELRGEVIRGCPELLARADLLIESADVVALIDFKTSRGRWGPKQVAESALQLVLYGELARPLAEAKTLLLAFAVITKHQRPRLTLHPLPQHLADVDAAKATVARVWRDLQAGDCYASPSFRHCTTCPYRNRPCLAWRR
jgi:putative RecB family exonuclease